MRVGLEYIYIYIYSCIFKLIYCHVTRCPDSSLISSSSVTVILRLSSLSRVATLAADAFPGKHVVDAYQKTPLKTKTFRRPGFYFLEKDSWNFWVRSSEVCRVPRYDADLPAYN